MKVSKYCPALSPCVGTVAAWGAKYLDTSVISCNGFATYEPAPHKEQLLSF
ncbi:MAG: hypothetical protein QOK37_4540 [Thermoanaerobaculia bacterium]|jgi:hypothetical protein|nr:hypothetical protein [Thermoanaerobaculia bacterium]